uniref:Retrovirus-related Pol polyprotein from transposon TNT 1-94-like beta-barrel domain-containing protein n=1 Tax=Cajanus cajan TaxID=3821 RepID=A0A151SDT4_CAJCA|nr:hypothetical protein KK1_025274 [Cajanus cajan]
MTGTLENLWESRALDGYPVGLPNGELVLANKEGSVFLDGGLKLENVLYVPKLNCNLISVSQLTDEAKCTVHFTDRFCAMQDHTSRTLIGAGERKDGHYWYRGVSGMKAYQINAEDQLEIWHKRMGHPAYQIVEKIPNVSNAHRNKNTNQTC